MGCLERKPLHRMPFWTLGENVFTGARRHRTLSAGPQFDPVHTHQKLLLVQNTLQKHHETECMRPAQRVAGAQHLPFCAFNDSWLPWPTQLLQVSSMVFSRRIACIALV